jgi:hypothetical protein
VERSLRLACIQLGLFECMEKNAMQNVLILCDSDLSSAPRVRNQVTVLKDRCNLLTVGLGPIADESVRFLKFPRVSTTNSKSHLGFWTPIRKTISAGLRMRELFRRACPGVFLETSALSQSRRLLRDILPMKLDALIVHHAWNLPLAIKIKNATNCRVIANLHEYYPRQFESDGNWMRSVAPVNHLLCKRYLPRVDRVWTVSQGIANEYARSYCIDCRIVPNAKPYVAFTEQYIPNFKTIRSIYHGIAMPSRGLEAVIETVAGLEGHELTLMLTEANGFPDYYQYVRKIAERYNNIVWSNPVPTGSIVKTITSFDIGYFYYVPNSFNALHCLPNKFFECVQARLPFVVNPLPEVESLIRRYNCGFVSLQENVCSMRFLLQSLKWSEICNARTNLEVAAKDLCLEAFAADMADDVLGAIS